MALSNFLRFIVELLPANIIFAFCSLFVSFKKNVQKSRQQKNSLSNHKYNWKKYKANKFYA